MKNIGFFINSTINQKYFDINYHNIQTLSNNFNEIYICDETNKYSEQLQKKTKNIRNLIKFENVDQFNNFQKMDILFKTIKDENINSITIILDDYIYLNNLNSYFEFVNKCSYDLISFTDSTELFYHLQINLFTIKKEQINTVKKIINDYSIKNKNDYAMMYLEFLKELVNQIKNKTAFCKTAYIESVEKKNIYLSNTEYYYYLLSREILPIIKVKFLENIVKEYDNKEVVHKKIPLDFDIDIYRSYEDLTNFEDDFLIKHFLEYGQFECRKYKKSENILPKVLWEKLNKVKLVKYFDFPENFDFYSYKEKNDDLRKLNKIELKKHWINYGVYEDRKY